MIVLILILESHFDFYMFCSGLSDFILICYKSYANIMYYLHFFM